MSVTEYNTANPTHGESFHATSTLEQAVGSKYGQCNPRLLRHTYNKTKETIKLHPVYIKRNPCEERQEEEEKRS